MALDGLNSGVVRPGVERPRLVRARVADPARIAALVASEAWLASARVLKVEAGSSVVCGRVDGLGVVVKSRLLRGARERIGAAVGFSRGLRQWRGAELLRGAGLETADPLVLFRAVGAAGPVETLVMEELSGPTLVEVAAGPVGQGGGEGGVRLGGACGALVGAMLRAGLRNRDLKASNVIVRPDGTLAQIDTVGVSRRAGGGGGGGSAEMLMRLVVECVGTGVTPRRSVMWAAVKAACAATGEDPRGVWREVRRRLIAHGDPTPKVNPLSGPVGAPGSVDQ